MARAWTGIVVRRRALIPGWSSKHRDICSRVQRILALALQRNYAAAMDRL
jgi:hypothetical protein